MKKPLKGTLFLNLLNILRNAKKPQSTCNFQHAEIYVKTEEGRLFVQVLQIYILQIVKFDEKSLILYQRNIPKLVKEIFMSIYDMLIKQGKEEGVIKVIRKIFKTKPSLTNEQIAQMIEQPVAFIEKIRQSTK